MFVYITTNLINNKKYIGYCTRNDDNYLGSGKLLHQAIKKYGKHNFDRKILEECNTIEEVCNAEKKWIDYYNAVDSNNFYNIGDGGYGGNPVALKKYWNSLTKEERKLRNNYIKNMDKSGKNNPMYGKTHSAETKKLIGSKSINRNWHHPDHIGSNNPRAKRAMVEYNGNIKYYTCLKDACNDLNISYSSLKSIAQSKTNYSKKYNIKVKYVT